MKLSCAFFIVVLFVTGLNIPLVASGTSSSTSSSTKATAANTTAASTSTTTTAANTTAASTSTTTISTTTTSTTTTSLTTTAAKYECISFTCNDTGCLTNASNPSNCTGEFCTIVQRFNQTSYNIKAACASSCTEKDEADGNFTVRTRCCQSTKCNKDDKQIVALPTKTSGSTSNQARLWILSIMLFISAFEILL